jgi:hypothetical protein
MPHTATVTSITGVNGETGATVGTVDVSNTTHTAAATYAADHWSFTGTANYNNIAATTITDAISKADATVVVTPYSVTYDGLPHTATYTITGLNGETGATVGTVNVSNTTHTNAGTYNADSWSFTGTANYNNIAATTITDKINKAPLSITADADVNTAAVDGFSKTYDGQVYSGFTVRYSGFVNSETPAALSGTLSFSGTGTTATAPGGPYPVTPGGLTSGNYYINFVSGTLTINNVAPSNVTSNAPVINENGTANLSGSFSDPDPGQAHTVSINWGDGSPTTVLPTLAIGVTTFSASHQYLDDNPTGTPVDVKSITISVSDGATSISAPTTVTVNNVAPVIGTVTGPTTPQPAGSSITVTTNFTDVGTKDTHVCSVNWDDDTTSNGIVTETNGSGTCTATHTYTTPGVYSVIVTITDDDTGSASRGLDLQYVVIFDPNSGFVTGGGWIMSPAGACQLTPGCATATGRANFGFVSKYQKGSNTPDGQTEFQFQAGDINFHSSAYDYGSLVVSGYKAQYRGTGDINGVSGYKFVLTAYDGDVNGGGGIDKFRIKITKNGVVVYDNRVGASDDIDLANPTAISGGSIVIHK